MGFVHWVTQAFHAGVSKISDVVDRIRNGLAGLWHILTGLGHVVGKAWHTFTGAVSWLLAWLEQVTAEIVTKLRHIALVVIPRVLNHALAKAYAWAQQVLHQAISWASDALSWLRQHLLALLADLSSWAHSAVRWLIGHVGQLASDLARTMRRVWSLLDDPGHLAAWVAGSLWSYVWRWVNGNAVALGRWFLRNGVQLVLHELGTVEDWLARII